MDPKDQLLPIPYDYKTAQFSPGYLIFSRCNDTVDSKHKAEFQRKIYGISENFI